MHVVLVVLAVATLAGCGTDEEPLFPATYAATYIEVRDCRRSLDHDLMRVRVLASPDAAPPYLDRATPFPVGAIVLKEQFPLDDMTCAGPVEQFTVMAKLAGGSSTKTLDWEWQKVDAARSVIATEPPRCVGCHAQCGVPPDGYDSTCTVP